ncbi:hypothetical protein [Vibrio parahaemolyticus]|uniref:hypothetical protein n=1 Tax=Vibrio parahaemolyticus TaxID=670 RepID=UPI0003FB62CA|nr:hypothetical protein [Vibrio parahaemolyticus]HCE4958437.1 hypothetical protein [Vibrio parahaemolyticus]
MEIFNNAWFVGIGGGVLSGLIVTVITRYLFSRKDNREYLQKISSVNREIVYALRPGISEGHIPEEQVLTALINSTSRKYRVNRDDVYKPKQVAEELIKEIMDSSFISSETKKSYCETLSHFVQERDSGGNNVESNIERKVAESEYRQKLTEQMSAVLGLTAALGTMLFAFDRVLDKATVRTPITEFMDLLLPTMTVLGSTLVAMASMLAVVRLKRLKNKNNGSSEDKT